MIPTPLSMNTETQKGLLRGGRRFGTCLPKVMCTGLVVVACASVLAVSSRDQAPSWKPVEGHLLTRFARDVSPDAPRPEYPRPQLVRKDWLNLNGLWQYAIRPKDAISAGSSFDGDILVPFPVESALSGVGRSVAPDQRLWYRRLFRVPPAWKGKRVWLRFDAVDWESTVLVNGREVGRHTGGYDPFGFDVTDALTRQPDQEIVLSVWDPSDAGSQPRGKQVLKPRGIWYTATTGIWQTVWLEPLPAAAIERLTIVPDIDKGTVSVAAVTIGRAEGLRLRATIAEEKLPVASAEGPAARPLTITVPMPRLWSPKQPFLYTLTVTLVRGERVVDEVASYVGLRKISIGRTADGVARLLVNNEPLFQYGFLDQGFWPGGLHTAPTDEAIRFDIAATLGLGMNLARKHIKVEPERWYYWADKLGLLVWQDMPSGKNDTPESRANFAREWQRIIDARSNHPSIVMWVTINEGWGQPDKAGTRELADWTARYDPTRLVNNASGWTDAGAGHVTDIHRYPGPSMPGLERDRAAVLGEYGGLGLPVSGHTWQDEKNWGYVSYKDASEFERAYRERVAELRLLVARGLSAAVYTQTTDVEVEVNGLITYDRAVVKIAPERLLAINRTLYDDVPRATTVLPTSELAGRTWTYTTSAPTEAWLNEGFDDTSWERGVAPFAAGSTEGVPQRTAWTTNDIWLRQSFEWTGGPTDGLYVVLAHDEDAIIYINGVEAARVTGYTTGYVIVPVAAGAARALKPGSNLIAVTCHQTKGGQAIDVGMVRMDRK
jgi:hypothetical protein